MELTEGQYSALCDMFGGCSVDAVSDAVGVAIYVTPAEPDPREDPKYWSD